MSKKPLYQNLQLPVEVRIKDLLYSMSLEQKIGQMIQAEWPNVSPEEMEEYGLGSLLNGGEVVPEENTPRGWRDTIARYQSALSKTKLKIPLIFGIDAVHGHNNVYGATIFPHNIGLGAANDEKGVFEMSQVVAEEVLLTGINWNFAPCLALAKDPRWGRTYESFSTDQKIVERLSTAFTRGHLERGMVTCAKHFIGDGNTQMGTGLNNLIDRGDAHLSEDEIWDVLLPAYQIQIDLGVQTIMPSYSSLNGTKMHQYKYYLTDILKEKLYFKGFLITDYEAVREIPNANFEQQIWIAINAGIDMLMEPTKWKSAYYAIKRGVENGHISQARIDDAVARVLRVKLESGLFENPYLKQQSSITLRSEKAKKVALNLAEKSLVLLKNENQQIPIKAETKIFLCGAGSDDIGLQCGGWTISWNGQEDGNEKITLGTTLLEGLRPYVESHNIKIITDKHLADKADIIVMVLSETPYAEMQGDSQDIAITGKLGHPENSTIIDFANTLEKPIITVLFAGRHLAGLENYLTNWDSCIMAYLPGSEGGEAVANLLMGTKPFKGKLPMPWYKTVDDIGDSQPELLFDLGYGL